MSSSERTWQGKVALGASAAAAVVAYAQLRRWQWRMRRCAAKAKSTPPAADADILRLGFSKKRLPDEIDDIVIGSGLSGLYLAALLGKMGRRVVVLEQHYVAGGCTHSFKDKGFEFDTGVHYMGMATQFCGFMDFAANREGAFRMERQGEDDGSQVYNEFHAGGRCVHRYRPGPRTFVEDLVAKWPQEEKAIRRFFLDVKFCNLGMGLVVSKQFVPAVCWRAMLRVPSPLRWFIRRAIQRSLNEALADAGIQDGMLKAAIGAEFGDYGVTPDQAPFFLHAGILGHYMPEGGFAPVGGSDAFANTLVAPVLEAGGVVLVRAPVERIVVEAGRAVGVQVKGATIRARKSVVSAAGVEVTYRKLLDEVEVQKLGGPPDSLLASEKMGKAHHVYGFVGFEGTTEELRLPTYNVWSLPPAAGAAESDISAVWSRLFGPRQGERPAFLESDEAAAAAQVPAFISFPSAKDSSYASRCPGKSTAVVLTEGHPDYFGKESGATGKRSEEYEVIKKRYGKVLMNALYRHFPHLQGKVSYVDFGTPQSNEHYLGRTASYGLDQDAARFLDPTLRVAVPRIGGLYLTGQDILCGGVFPQVFSAWITLAKMVGPLSPDFWIMTTDFLLHTARRALLDRTYVPKFA